MRLLVPGSIEVFRVFDYFQTEMSTTHLIYGSFYILRPAANSAGLVGRPEASAKRALRHHRLSLRFTGR